ncbi:MAG: hypothetical protein Q9187_000875, partial [Circinaria calcarea]
PNVPSSFSSVTVTASQDAEDRISPLRDLLDNVFPSPPFRKWLQLATSLTLTSYNLLARRFRRGKDYSLATNYTDEASRLEITLGITPTNGWGDDDVHSVIDNPDDDEPPVVQSPDDEKPKEKENSPRVAIDLSNEKQGAAENTNDEKEKEDDYNPTVSAKSSHEKEKIEYDDYPAVSAEPSNEKKKAVEDHPTLSTNPSDEKKQVVEDEDSGVGGYEVYMAGDDDTYDDYPDHEGSDHGVPIPSTLSTSTGARASGPSSGPRPKSAKADPAIYRSSSGTGDEDDGVLFSMPAGWNRLSVVLRDKGVLRFVKYVGMGAKGDRWDLTGEFGVKEEEEDEEEEEGEEGPAREEGEKEREVAGEEEEETEFEGFDFKGLGESSDESSD